MKGRTITAKAINEFKEHLVLEERSMTTIEKYIRDVKAFAVYAKGGAVTKEAVIAYSLFTPVQILTFSGVENSIASI